MLGSSAAFVTSIFLFLFVIVAFCHANDDIYSFSVEDGAGGNVSLQHFRGKTLLIVNVASECGYTDNHYKGLVAIQNKYASDNFQVLAFPCNDFGQQEPNDTPQIIAFAQNNYALNFPIYAKVNILANSPNASPLFKFLQDKTNETINWNFHKFLISSEGEVVGGWGPRVGVFDLEDKVRHHLGLPTQKGGKGGQHRGSRSEF